MSDVKQLIGVHTRTHRQLGNLGCGKRIGDVFDQLGDTAIAGSHAGTRPHLNFIGPTHTVIDLQRQCHVRKQDAVSRKLAVGDHFVIGNG